METRVRLPENLAVGSLNPLELLDLYWSTNHTKPEEAEALNALAAPLIQNEAES